MAEPQTPKTTRTGTPKTGRDETTGRFHVYRPKGGTSRILAALPKDATVVVIPNTAAAENAIRKTGDYVRVARSRSAGLESSASKAARPAVRAQAFEPDARARAILRGVGYAQQDLMASGGAYDVEQVRTLLHGVTRQAVDKRIAEGALIAVPGPSGRRRFPTVQFNDDGSVVEGLKEVQAALGYASPWSVLNFLINGHDLLKGERPIDVLRRGEGEKVVQAARSVGVQGA